MQKQVSAILLAAGSSRRMGRLKQLLPLGDRTVIEQCIGAIIAAGTKDVVVVLGPDAGEIASVVRTYPVTTVLNRQRESEMAESVKTGLAAVSSNTSGILMCLADHPLVMSETIAGLIALHGKCPDSIIVPSFNRRRGHPTLFPIAVAKEIFAAGSLRDIIERHAGSITYMDTKDEGVLLDMDEMDDYEEVLRRFSGGVSIQ